MDKKSVAQIIGNNDPTASGITEYFKKASADLNSDLPHGRWKTKMHEVWSLLNSAIDDDLSGEVIQNTSKDISDLISRHWYRYVRQLEMDISFGYITGERFGRPFTSSNDDYIKEFSLLPEFNRDRVAVFPGCGPLPTTLIWASYQKGLASRFVAFDRCGDSIKTARTVFRICSEPTKFDSANFEIGEAEHFKYKDPSIVFINMAIQGKYNVIKRIAETSPSDTVILFREPKELLRLVAECVLDKAELPGGFKVIGSTARFTAYQAYALECG